MGLDVKQTITCVQLLYQAFLWPNVLPRKLCIQPPTPPRFSPLGRLLCPHLSASQTPLRPAPPTQSPALTECVAAAAAAAAAEITTKHPGREQPADGIDYLYCQNN